MIENVFNLSTTERAVLSILSDCLGGEKFKLEDFDGELNWREIFEEMKVQAVAGLPFDFLYDHEGDIPSSVYDDWLKYAKGVYGKSERMLYAQDCLCRLMEKNDIPMVILKGTSAAINYPNLRYRNFGDIDFFVSSDNFQKAYEVMVSDGYELLHDGGENAHHAEFIKNRIVFELHREVPGIANGKIGEEIRQIYDNIFKDTIDVDFEGYRMHFLPNLYQSLSLLMHMAHHLDIGLGMRHICDWMMFVKNHIRDEAWYLFYKPLYDKYGMSNFAIILTNTCKLGFDSVLDVSWCDDADIGMCRELVSLIFRGGNFGIKRESVRNSVFFTGKFTNSKDRVGFICLFKTIHQLGISNWKLVKRLKWLKAVAFIYPIYTYSVKIIKGKRSPKEIKRLFDEGKVRRNLKDGLHIYEVEGS